ncbi:MAG: LysR family transcriptional regulator [Solirubrobacteraceae bacterium]
MTITQLQYVLAVAKYKNFTIAAEKSFVTQPTLSMQIQKLESEFTIEIFDRQSQPIKLTKIGELVVKQTESILKEVNRMKAMIMEDKGDLSGTFILGIIPTVLPSLVPLFLKTFNKRYPNTNLVIKELKTDEIIAQLKENTIDFGILVTPLLNENIVEKVLYYEPMVAYVPRNHKLASKSILEQNDLDVDDILLLKDGNCFKENVLNLCGKQTRKNTLNMESGSFSTLINLADEGFGMTILPSLISEDISESRKKNILLFNNPVPTREISIIHYHNQFRDTFKTELIKVIQGVIRGKLQFSSNNVTAPTISLPIK